MAKQKLTTKQQRFVDFYDGNATQAAKKAGYKGTDRTLAVVGVENLTKPNIAEAIKNREKKRNGKHIATREERQRFWTNVKTFDIRNFYDKNGGLKAVKDLDDLSARLIQSIKVTKDGDEIEYKLPDRLKASELLGRSEADFTENKHHTGGVRIIECDSVETPDNAGTGK